MTMSVQSSSSYPIVSSTSYTLNAATTESVVDSTSSFSNQSFALTISSAYLSSVYYPTYPQSFSVVANNAYSLSLLLPCSPSSTTSISYSLATYNSGQIPSFVSVNTTTGILTLSATTEQSTTFLVNSAVTSVTIAIPKVVSVTVKKCTVDNCQTCSSSSTNICTLCNSGYLLYNSICYESLTDKSSSTTTTSIQITLGLTGITTIITSFTNGSTLASFWSMLNQLQLLFFLILTNAFLPEAVVNVILGSKFALVISDQIPVKKVKTSQSILNVFNSNQVSSALSEIGVESGSSIVNLYSFFCSLCTAFFVHLIVKCILKCIPNSKHEGNRCTLSALFYRLVRSIIKIMTLGYYIRLILETQQFMILSAISEVNRLEVTSAANIASFILSVVIIIACVCFLIITVILAVKPPKIEQDEYDKFENIFEGIKEDKCKRLYTFWLMLRRIIFSLLLIIFSFSSLFVQLSIMIVVQITYTINLIIQRPFEDTKDNVVEIINEIYFCFYISYLFKFNTIVDWSSASTGVYIWTIFSSSVLIMCVGLVDTTSKLTKKHCSKKKQNEQVVPVLTKAIRINKGLYEESKEYADHSRLTIRPATSLNDITNC